MSSAPYTLSSISVSSFIPTTLDGEFAIWSGETYTFERSIFKFKGTSFSVVCRVQQERRLLAKAETRFLQPCEKVEAAEVSFVKGNNFREQQD